jgi:hypothetical protein
MFFTHLSETPFHHIRFKMTDEEKIIDEKKHKNQKKKQRIQQKDEIRDQKQRDWQSFQKKNVAGGTKKIQNKSEKLVGSIDYQPLKKKKYNNSEENDLSD